MYTALQFKDLIFDMAFSENFLFVSIETEMKVQ